MSLRPNESNARFWQVLLLLLLLVVWHLSSRNEQFAFFVGEPIKVAGRIWSWFMPVAIPPNPLFPEGLPGFERERRFLPLEMPDQHPLVFLQSAATPALCFVTLPVLAVSVTGAP